MQKASNIFYIMFVMALVLMVSLVIGGMLWMSGMKYFFPLLVVLYAVIGIFVVRAVIEWKKNHRVVNRIMAAAIALSVLYAVPGLYGKVEGMQQETVSDQPIFIEE